MRPAPWIAAILNFFLPGVGFVYCGTKLLAIVGGLLFIASLNLQFSVFTVANVIGTTMTMFERLTVQRFVSAFGIAFLLAILGYVAADYVNKRGSSSLL